MPDVVHASRIDFGQESLSGPELRLLLARVKRLEAGGTPDQFQYVSYAYNNAGWINDVSNCIVFTGLTEDTTISNDVFGDTTKVFRIGNNSAYTLTLTGGGHTMVFVPYEFATARYVGSWVHIVGIN
jgi:hypothetical protein